MGDHGDAMMRNQNAAVQARPKAQNRANVMQLKLIGQSHPTGLTANLLKLFEPRPPLEYKPPPEKRKCPPYTGMAQFVSNFAKHGDLEYAPPIQKGETPAERRVRIHRIRLEEGAKMAAEGVEKYNPNNDPHISGDPYKTLFVARLNYETTESRIKREFEAYGPIKQVRLVTDKETNKPRGYAFIEYVHTRDMKAAYKQADGRKIDNRRVLVDVERGRTVPNWRPCRLGGGLGTTRVGGEEAIQRNLGREQVQSGRISRSEEPRVERDREKSRERGRVRERERERSRELSHDRPRDPDHRDDRNHRDRDRNRDRERDHVRDREKDRTRNRDQGRSHDRNRDHDRDRDRFPVHGRKMDRARDYDVGVDHDRGRSRDRVYEHSKHERAERERDYVEESRGWPDHPEHGRGREHDDHGHSDYYGKRGRGQYDDPDGSGDYDRYRVYDRENDHYDQMDEDGYGYDRAASEGQDRDYHRSDRSLSREYEY